MLTISTTNNDWSSDMSFGSYKGPSAAELQAIAKAQSDAEIAKYKAESEAARVKLEGESQARQQQYAIEQSNKMAERDAEKARLEAERKAQEDAEKKKVADEIAAQQQSMTESQKQLAADMARRKTFLESFWYLDQEDEDDPANMTAEQRRQRAARAQ